MHSPALSPPSSHCGHNIPHPQALGKRKDNSISSSAATAAKVARVELFNQEKAYLASAQQAAGSNSGVDVASGKGSDALRYLANTAPGKGSKSRSDTGKSFNSRSDPNIVAAAIGNEQTSGQQRVAAAPGASSICGGSDVFSAKDIPQHAQWAYDSLQTTDSGGVGIGGKSKSAKGSSKSGNTSPYDRKGGKGGGLSSGFGVPDAIASRLPLASGSLPLSSQAQLPSQLVASAVPLIPAPARVTGPDSFLASAPAANPVAQTANSLGSACGDQPIELALDQLLDKIKAHTAAVVQKSQQEIQGELYSTVSQVVRQLDANLQRQIDSQHRHSTANSEAIVRLEQQVQSILASQAQIFSRLEAGQLNLQQCVTNGVSDVKGDWDRAPDPGLIKANCQSIISLRSFADLVVPLLQALGYSMGTHFSLPGNHNVLNKFWSIQFLGQISEASIAAARFLGSLKEGPRRWRKIFALSPSGVAVQVFVGPDKSPHQQALEMTTKRLSNLLTTALGEWSDQLFTMRPEGLIFYNWEPLCQVKVAPGGLCTVGWEPELADYCCIEQASVVATLCSETLAAAEAGKGMAALRARAAKARWSI